MREPWHSPTDRALQQIKHLDLVWDVKFDSRGQRLATACRDGVLRIIDCRSGIVEREVGTSAPRQSRAARIVTVSHGPCSKAAYSPASRGSHGCTGAVHVSCAVSRANFACCVACTDLPRRRNLLPRVRAASARLGLGQRAREDRHGLPRRQLASARRSSTVSPVCSPHHTVSQHTVLSGTMGHRALGVAAHERQSRLATLAHAFVCVRVCMRVFGR
jgi:hypothetical protein